MNESAEFLQHISIDSNSKNSLPVKPACENHNRLKDRVKKPRGGYRPVMLDEKSQLAKESIELEPLMKFINEEKSLSDQDKVSLFTLAYLNERYPNNFLECYNPIVVDSDISKSSKSLCDLPIKFKNQKVYSRLQSLNVRTLFDVVNSFNLHSVPHSARFTLVNWYLPSRFDLVLFVDRIPSSKQVLKMQANSKRCVTIITNKIDELVLGERDPFSFLLHDLVHAYKMFSNDYLLSGQLGFYRALLKLFSTSDDTKSTSRTQSCSILEPLLTNDVQLVDEFDYLISDMNSHPRHLFFYFKAILITAIKRKHHLDGPDSRLSGSSLYEFDALFESVLERFAMNETEKSLARQMITDETSRNKSAPKPSNTVDFTLLDNFFLSLS